MAFTLLNVFAPLALVVAASLWIFFRTRPDLRSPSALRGIRWASLVAALLVCTQAFAWLRRASVDDPADFSFINRGELTTLDPNRMSWMQDIRVGYALWEGLYILDPETLDNIPGAAERIETSDDKLTWTFHMRRNGKWSNGDPVTSHDFVFAWRRMLEQVGDYTYLLSKNIKGADAYSKAATDYAAAYGKYRAKAIADGALPAEPPPTPPSFETVGIKAPDDMTFVVTLEHPVAIFPDLAAFPSFFPLNEKSLKGFFLKEEEPDKKLKSGEPVPPLQPPGMLPTLDKRFTRPPHLVTNGPYRLDKWEFKKRVRMVANEYYWDPAGVKSKTIDVISCEDPMAQFLLFDSKRVDWLTEVPADIAADMKDHKRPDLKVFPAFGTYFYTFNCKPNLPDGSPNPFADVRVRKALTMALDKSPVVNNVTRMGEQVSTLYIPPNVFPGYRSPPGIPFDPDGARKLLAEAGYGPGKKEFPKLSLLFNTGNSHGEIAQIVRRQWFDVLGIDISLEGVEVNAFRQRQHNTEFAVCRASWFGDYADPSTFTDKYLSDSDNNDGRWVNLEFDKLCGQAAVAKTNEERLRLFEEAEKILLDEAAILPVYTYVNTYAFRSDLKGIPLNYRNMVNFKSVWKEK